MFFKKFRQRIKTINQIVDFVHIVEDFAKKNSDKIEQIITLVRQLAELVPGAKEQAETIINYLKEQIKKNKKDK